MDACVAGFGNSQGIWRATAVDLEGARPDAECEGQASQQRAGAAKPETGFAAQSGEDDAGGDRGGHRRRHLDRHRQRVQRLVHRQRMADQRAHHGLAGHHGVHQRLAEEQQVDVAVHGRH